MYSEGGVIDYTPVGAVTQGQVVVIGTIPMVATRAIAAGVKGSLTNSGVFKLPKTTDTFSAGDAVYWSATNSPVVGDSSSGAADNATGDLAGYATADALTGDTYVYCELTAAKRTTTISGSVTADDITGSDSSLGVTGKTGNASAGGAVAIAGGVAAAGANDGGAVTIVGGAGPTAGNVGGAITITSGAGDVTNGTAGAIVIDSGAGATKGAITIGTNAASITLGKMPRVPFAVLAANGGNIATAAAVTAGWTLVTGADNSVGVQLPSCVNGAQVVLINQNTDKTLKVYPPLGKQINGAGANNAIVMAVNTMDTFASEGANAWYGTTALLDLS